MESKRPLEPLREKRCFLAYSGTGSTNLGNRLGLNGFTEISPSYFRWNVPDPA